MKFRSPNALLSFVIFTVVLITTVFAIGASEAPQTFTLEAQVFQVGTTEPLLESNIKITLQILNQAKDCLLYEEQQWVDTTSTNGEFRIQVGSNIGDGKRTANDLGHSMSAIFQNSSLIGGKSLANPDQSCGSAADVASLAKSVRYFRVTITPSSSNIPDVLSPDTLIDTVPTALVAQSLQGLGKESFIQTNSGQGVTQSHLESVFRALQI